MPDVLVLCYHAVSRTWPAALSVTPDSLERQLEILLDRGYRGRRLTDVVAKPPTEATIVVTFDDNYRSVLESAKPILDRYALPGTLYVPTDWPEDPRPMRWPGIDRWLGTEHEHELRSLHWDELRALVAEGWEIGSHTRSHPRLPTLTDEALRVELRGSREKLESELQCECTSIAYPYGAVDRRVEQATEAVGYLAGVSIPRVVGERRPLNFPRVPIFHSDSELRFKAKASPLVRRLRGSSGLRKLDAARVAYAERAARVRDHRTE